MTRDNAVFFRRHWNIPKTSAYHSVPNRFEIFVAVHHFLGSSVVIETAYFPILFFIVYSTSNFRFIYLSSFSRLCVPTVSNHVKWQSACTVVRKFLKISSLLLEAQMIKSSLLQPLQSHAHPIISKRIYIESIKPPYSGHTCLLSPFSII